MIHVNNLFEYFEKMNWFIEAGAGCTKRIRKSNRNLEEKMSDINVRV